MSGKGKLQGFFFKIRTASSLPIPLAYGKSGQSQKQLGSLAWKLYTEHIGPEMLLEHNIFYVALWPACFCCTAPTALCARHHRKYRVQPHHGGSEPSPALGTEHTTGELLCPRSPRHRVLWFTNMNTGSSAAALRMTSKYAPCYPGVRRDEGTAASHSTAFFSSLSYLRKIYIKGTLIVLCWYGNAHFPLSPPFLTVPFPRFFQQHPAGKRSYITLL